MTMAQSFFKNNTLLRTKLKIVDLRSHDAMEMKIEFSYSIPNKNPAESPYNLSGPTFQ